MKMFKTKEVNLESGKSSWRWKPNQTLRSLLLSVLWLGHQPVAAFEAMWDKLLPQPSPSWILRNVGDPCRSLAHLVPEISLVSKTALIATHRLRGHMS